MTSVKLGRHSLPITKTCSSPHLLSETTRVIKELVIWPGRLACRSRIVESILLGGGI